jgi:outer membrane protein assembly factor BamB
MPPSLRSVPAVLLHAARLSTSLAFCALLLHSFPTAVDEASAQSPRILWRFDTRDASFGQTASGDIDGDGKLELVFGCYRNDSSIYALNAEDGSLLWKFNAAGPGTDGCNDVAPLIIDADGDGVPDVIVPASCNPTTFCFDGKTGSVKWAAPTRGSDSPPTAADMDGDGKLEILHGEFGGYVRCINAEDGSTAWDIPVDRRSWIQTAPTLLDADGDGAFDFVVATWNRNSGDTNAVYAYKTSDRTLLWRTPLADVVYHGTAVADLDRDGKAELVIGDYSGAITALNAEDGSIAWTYRHPNGYYAGAPASIADLNGDGRCEIIAIDWYTVLALSHDGRLLWDYSIPGAGTSFRGAALADVDGDGLPDAVFGTDKGALIALKGNDGSTIAYVDLAADFGDARFAIDHAPVIADFDGDGTLDAFLVGGHTEYPDFSGNFGRGYAVSLGSGTGPEWLMFQNNIRRDGNICADGTNAISAAADAAPAQVWLYPLPARETINISARGLAGATVLDVTGRILDIRTATDDALMLDLSAYPAGVYFLLCRMDGEVAVRSFVKR